MSNMSPLHDFNLLHEIESMMRESLIKVLSLYREPTGTTSPVWLLLFKHSAMTFTQTKVHMYGTSCVYECSLARI